MTSATTRARGSKENLALVLTAFCTIVLLRFLEKERKVFPIRTSAEDLHLEKYNANVRDEKHMHLHDGFFRLQSTPWSPLGSWATSSVLPGAHFSTIHLNPIILLPPGRLIFKSMIRNIGACERNGGGGLSIRFTSFYWREGQPGGTWSPTIAHWTQKDSTTAPARHSAFPDDLRALRRFVRP